MLLLSDGYGETKWVEYQLKLSRDSFKIGSSHKKSVKTEQLRTNETHEKRFEV